MNLSINLADRLWSLLDQHFVYRLVLEMDYVDFFPSQLMGQLVMLHKRVLKRGGLTAFIGTITGMSECLAHLSLGSGLASFFVPQRSDAWRRSWRGFEMLDIGSEVSRAIILALVARLSAKVATCAGHTSFQVWVSLSVCHRIARRGEIRVVPHQ